MRILYRIICFLRFKPFREIQFDSIKIKYIISLKKPIVFKNLIYLPFEYFSTKEEVCKVRASKFIRMSKFSSYFSSKIKIK